MQTQTTPLKVFIVYAHEDKDVRDKLLRHLRVQAVKGEIELWSDHEIKPGDVWDDAIRQRLNESELILLLISADFFNSDYIQNVELQEVMQRNAAGNCRLLPIIARDCDWTEHPLIGRLQALPPSGKPVMSKDWNSEDEPYRAIVEGFKVAARELRGAGSVSQGTNLRSGPSARIPRVFDPKPTIIAGVVLSIVLGIWGVSNLGKKQNKIDEPIQRSMETPSPEEEDWTIAQRQNTVDAYNNFTIIYPAGKHTSEAESNKKALVEKFDIAIRNAEAMLQAGNPVQARNYFEAAQKIAPNHQDIQRMARIFKK